MQAGTCSGTTNTITCTPQELVCDAAEHYRNSANECTPCANVVCAVPGQYRDGVCIGKSNGYTCKSCTNTVCPTTDTRRGICTGTTNGWYCEPNAGGVVINVACAANQYRKGSSPGECYTCSNIVCPAGMARTGRCGGPENGWVCTGSAAPGGTTSSTQDSGGTDVTRASKQQGASSNGSTFLPAPPAAGGTSTTTAEPDSEGGSSSGGVLVGIIIACVVVLFIVVAFVLIRCCRKEETFVRCRSCACLTAPMLPCFRSCGAGAL